MTNTAVIGQDQALTDIKRLLDIFINSECEIRPHFFLTGPSGSGKTLAIDTLCKKLAIQYVEINAAQLTKEGTSGNSLSKALAPLGNIGDKPVICFVDEFDKLFISGNSNSMLAHESTNGVQNEFLKVLEGNTASVFGDYGKYNTIPVDNVLFIFAGAFNNEENITIDRLRDFGIKTEFLGRVGLVYSLSKLSLDNLKDILSESSLLQMYLQLFEDIDRNECLNDLNMYLEKVYDNNTLGARIINTMLNQYFIKGGLPEDEVQKITFQKKLSFKNRDQSI